MAPRKRLRVALISSWNLPGQIRQNLDRHADWVERAVARRALFVGFPECSLTGYRLSAEVAAAIEGPEVDGIVRLARRHRIYISAGLVERRAGRFFNTQLLAGPSGMIGVMRKINLTSKERRFFTAGSDFPVFGVGPARIGIAICADATHYETPHLLALRGANAIFAPHATYLKRTPKSWTEWRQRRWALYAADFAAYFLGCNNAGLPERPCVGQKDLGFASGAIVIGSQGSVVACSRIRRNCETMLIADLDFSAIPRLRRRLFAFTDVRRDLFFPSLLPRSPGRLGG